MKEEIETPSKECMEREAYLVSRGVRPLAQIGCCSSHYATLNIIRQKLAEAAQSLPKAIPFVVDHNDGIASYGYTTTFWAADLYRWAGSGAVPEDQRHRILGLVLGYSPQAIQDFEERGLCERAGDPPWSHDEEKRTASLLLFPSDDTPSMKPDSPSVE